MSKLERWQGKIAAGELAKVRAGDQKLSLYGRRSTSKLHVLRG